MVYNVYMTISDDNQSNLEDTDELAAETRQLLDAATEGDWDQVGATVEKEVDVGWCIVVAECDKVADAELIAAAPRLLANWLARNEQTEAVEDDLGRIANENAALAGRLMAERDRLADENRALREQLDAAQLRSIEARNPGIDMDGVRSSRAAAADWGVTDGEATTSRRPVQFDAYASNPWPDGEATDG